MIETVGVRHLTVRHCNSKGVDNFFGLGASNFTINPTFSPFHKSAK